MAKERVGTKRGLPPPQSGPPLDPHLDPFGPPSGPPSGPPFYSENIIF